MITLTSHRTLAGRSFSAVFQTHVAALVNCKDCGRRTNLHNDDENEQKWDLLKSGLTPRIISFNDLIETAFTDSPTPFYCARCKQIAPRGTRWRIVKPSGVLLIDIDQIHDYGVKPGQKVPDIPNVLDLDAFLHENAAANGITAHYRLVGAINHQGPTANAGHYVSHVRHVSGSWYLLNDNRVSPSSVVNLQKYAAGKKNGQMIPRLLAYVRIHDDKDEAALATRAKTPGVAPRPFLHPQILYDDSMALKELKALCKLHELSTSNTKKIDSLRALIDRANGIDSRFGTRSKGWLISNLINAGEKVDPTSKRDKLAEQMRNFMATQPAPATAPGSDAGEQPPLQEHQPSGAVVDAATTNAALVTARAQIVELQQTVEDLEGRLRIAETGQHRRSGSEARSPQFVSTDYIRDLIRRLPTSPDPNRATKRVAENDADQTPETKKRRVIQLAGDVCATIDAGTDSKEVAGVEQRYGRSDSDQENQEPSRNINITSSPPTNVRLRCHRCPTIPGEIHHIHATVCGWQPGRYVSAPTASELAEDIAMIEAQRPNISSEETEPSPQEIADGEEGENENFDALPSDRDETRAFLNEDTRGSEVGDETRAFLNSDGNEYVLHNPRSPSDHASTLSFLSNSDTGGPGSVTSSTSGRTTSTRRSAYNRRSSD